MIHEKLNEIVYSMTAMDYRYLSYNSITQLPDDFLRDQSSLEVLYVALFEETAHQVGLMSIIVDNLTETLFVDSKLL